MRHIKTQYHRAWKHWIRRGLLYAALVIFGADMLAGFIPPFALVWSGLAHICVAVASFAAIGAEFFIEEEEERHEGMLQPMRDVTPRPDVIEGPSLKIAATKRLGGRHDPAS